MNRQKRITVALGEHSHYKQLDDIDLRQTIRDFKQRELNRLNQSANDINGEEYEIRIGDRVLSDDSIVDLEIMQNDLVTFHKKEIPPEVNEGSNDALKEFSFFKYEKMALLLCTAIEVGALLHQYKNGKITSETFMKRSGASLGNNMLKTMESVRKVSFGNTSPGAAFHEIIRGPRPKLIFVIGAFSIGFYAQSNYGDKQVISQEGDQQLITPSIVYQKLVQQSKPGDQSYHKLELREQKTEQYEDFKTTIMNIYNGLPSPSALYQQALNKFGITTTEQLPVIEQSSKMNEQKRND